MWIDSHAHLTMYDPSEVNEILRSAADAGVEGILVPATCRSDLARTVELTKSYPDSVVAAVGVHPHDASSLDGELKRDIENALRSPGVVAVGEIGLDYHYMNSPREDQLRSFRWQLDLAKEADFPVVVHNRESWSDLVSVLGEPHRRLRGVCHSFTEDEAAAARVVELGLFVGISGMVTFKKADGIRAMASSLDLHRVLVETDSPFLAPVPYRGQRNQSAWVREIGVFLANHLGVDSEALARQTHDNFVRLFSPDW
ncbi:MAG: TatD family hydrolase [bacterium]|nr:TatD family hydrolase [bacterium]